MPDDLNTGLAQDAGDANDQQPKTVEELETLLATEQKHRAAQDRTITRQGNELREMRSLIDQTLLQQTRTATAAAAPAAEEIDFFADPKRAVNAAIAASPILKDMGAQREMDRRQLANAQLQAAHPDYLTIVAKPEFKEYVESDPFLRRIYGAANNGYDFSAGDYLMRSFKARQTAEATARAAGELRQTNDDALRTAKVTTGSASDTSGKKVYSRLDLMRLRTSDPDKYNSLNVQQLYAEGRVR